MPKAAEFDWKVELPSEGMGGLAATAAEVIASSRDVTDSLDVFQCFDARSGELLWEVSYPALGKLDYGNAPRATPLITAERVYLQGGMGDLVCVHRETGKIAWQKNYLLDFGAEPLTWGFCGSPLIVENRLIVQPGAKSASIVALDPLSGEVLWKTPGRPCGYSSLIAGTFGGKLQVIGYDQNSLGGWDVRSGQRLWELMPPHKGDFNVPTPIAVDGRLLVCTENNDTRLFDFDQHGRLVPKPLGTFLDLSPDSHTPVVIEQRVYGVRDQLFCLDLNAGLKPLWSARHKSFYEYTSLIGSPERLLITTLDARLLLLDLTRDGYALLGELSLAEDGSEIHGHPALADRALFVRFGNQLARLGL